MIPEAAVEAALNAQLTFKSQRGMDNAANQMRAILEAAAPHMLGYHWPLGDDDNPHRDGDVQPRVGGILNPEADCAGHWIVYRATGWGCDGCDWAGQNIEEFQQAHGRPDSDIPF